MDGTFILRIEIDPTVYHETVAKSLACSSADIARDLKDGRTYGQVQTPDGYQIGSWEIQ